MRGLARDMRKVWVSLYSTKEKVMSSNVWTGEWSVTRSKPFPVYASVTAGMSKSSPSLFGVNVSHDRVVTIDHVGTGITETSVMWIDKDPCLDQSGNATVPYDYTVSGVAESINVTSLAVSKDV